MKNIFSLIIAFFVIASISSCKKYREYENLDVIEDTFDGDMSVTLSSWDVDSEFSGTETDGSYCFIWENPARSATFITDITGFGTMRFEFEDARGNIVLNETLEVNFNAGATYQTVNGPKGNWFIKVFFTDFVGEGTFSLSTNQ